jgi:hypothetical protein
MSLKSAKGEGEISKGWKLEAARSNEGNRRRAVEWFSLLYMKVSSWRLKPLTTL